MRDTFDVELEPRRGVALSVEFTDFHGPVDEPSKFGKFGGIAGCEIVSEATGVSTRAEVKAINRKAEPSSASIVLDQTSHDEGTEIQLQQ